MTIKQVILICALSVFISSALLILRFPFSSIEHTRAVRLTSNTEVSQTPVQLINGLVASGVVTRPMRSEQYEMQGILAEGSVADGATILQSSNFSHQPGFFADATPTPIFAHTPTATPTLQTSIPNPGDTFEMDNRCDQANLYLVNGSPQQHNFHEVGDEDWIQFDMVKDKYYQIEVNVPYLSPADVVLEVYRHCGSLFEDGQNLKYTPGVRLGFSADEDGIAYLRIYNQDAEVSGEAVRYALSVRELSTEQQPGALILVAGKIKERDPVQPNIYHVTDATRQLFVDNGYDDDRIYYLAPDIAHANVDASATSDNLKYAITEWAADKVDANRPLTLYLMDHGIKDKVYLDKERSQSVTSLELDQWLSELEAEHNALVVNVIIEACYSGSFITAENGSVSKPGRVVITSTDDTNLAWATEDGASFSDQFLFSLRQFKSLYNSFATAREVALTNSSIQQAWIDGDGDGNPHDDASQTVAAQRGFGVIGTFSADVWSPFIKQVERPNNIVDGRGLLRIKVFDDSNVKHVWAVIYEPSYQAPTEGESLVQEAIPTIKLLEEGGDWFQAYYDGFNRNGTYRIVFYAEDDEAFTSRPVSIDVEVGQKVFLPVTRK